MTTTTSIPVRAAVQGEAQVLALLRQGREVSQISDVTTWPVTAVRRLAAREGLVIDDNGCARPAGTTAAQAAITRAELRELLRLAEASDEAQVKRARAKLDHAVEVLRGCLVEVERRKERQAAVAQLAADAEREVARLTAKLDQAKAQVDQAKTQLDEAKAKLVQARSVLGGPRRAAGAAARRYRPGVDYDTKQARAWAKANGYGDVLPTSGRYVPDDVIDAMRAAEAAPAGPEQAGTAQTSAAAAESQS
ncbi:hypothetical protein [Nonomuraea polychroma]|nr:hypothetical protein [Nonomuraea polychroma]